MAERHDQGRQGPLADLQVLELATLVGGRSGFGPSPSANVVVANMAARAGYPITFATFLRYGAVVTLLSLLLSTAYVWLRYFA